MNPIDDGAALNQDLAGQSQTSPTSSSTGSDHQASLQPLLADRSRDASASLKGYRYQVLVTLEMLLDLQPHQVIAIESAEDIELRDLHHPERPAPATGSLATKRVQVKDTAERTLDWSHDAICESALEFLIQHRERSTPPGTAYVLLTPAKLGASARSLLARWKSFREAPKADQKFAADLLQRLNEKAAKCERPLLKRLALLALSGASEDDIAAFAARVEWAGEHQRSEDLERTLAARLGDHHEVTTGFRGDVIVHILVDTIMVLASKRDADGKRILSPRFIAETLAAARGDQTAWNAKVAHLEKAIEAIPDKVVEALAPSFDDLKGHIDQRRAEDRQHLEQVLKQTFEHGKTTASVTSGGIEPLLFGAAIANATAEKSLVDLIATAQYTRAIALIGSALEGATGSRRALLLYLQASAWSGMESNNAIEAAREAAQVLAGMDGWDELMSGYADLLDGRRMSLESLRRIATNSGDAALRRCAHVLLAEAAFRDDRYAEVLTELAHVGADPRAIKLRLRAHAALHQFSEARALLGLFTTEDPERARLGAHVAMHELIAYANAPGAKACPADVVPRCLAVRTQLEAALAVCPREAKYRRLDLTANAAVTSLWARDHEGALARLKQAQRIDAGMPELHLQFAYVQTKLDQYPDAAESARAAIRGATQYAKRVIRTQARLLLARLTISEEGSNDEAEHLLRDVLGDEDIPDDFTQEARVSLVRARLDAKRLADANIVLDAWPERERGPRYRLAQAMVAVVAGDDASCLTHVAAIDALPELDLLVRHEARMFGAIAHFNCKRYREAADAGKAALATGVGPLGCEIVLAALRRVPGADAECDELEASILSEFPDHPEALRSRAIRLQERGELRAAALIAAQVARKTGTREDRYRAGMWLWRVNLWKEAADVFLVDSEGLTDPSHLIFASALLGAHGERTQALEFALRAHARAPSDKDALKNALHKVMQLLSHAELSAELQERVRPLFAAAAAHAGEDWPLTIVSAANLSVLQERAAEEQRRAAAFCHVYEYQVQDSAQLADALEQPHPLIIGAIMESANFHLHGRGPRRRPKAQIEAEWQGTERLLLDLPSFMMAQRIGAIPLLRRRWKLALLQAHATELAACRLIKMDELAMARRQVGRNLTPLGPQAIDVAAIEALVQLLDGLLDRLNTDVEITRARPLVIPPHERPADGESAQANVFDLLHHRVGARERVVVLEGCHGHVRGARVLLTELIDDLVPLEVIGVAEHAALLRAALASGLRGMGLPLNVIADTIACEAGIGPDSRRLIGHLREASWDTMRLTTALAIHMRDCAMGAMQIEPDRFALVVVGTLYGRSFTRSERRRAFRQLRAFAGSARWFSAPAVARRLRCYRAALTAAYRWGDPFRDDKLMPGPTRVYGFNREPSLTATASAAMAASA